MNQKFSLTVNGKVHAIEADPEMPLLYALKNDIGLNHPQFGCGLAQCGACTVHLDGQPIRSCITPLSAVGNGKVVTLAGLGTPEKPHPLQTAYVEEQVTQCGYCINGWIMTAAAFLRDKKNPTEVEIKAGARRPQMPLRHAHEHPARRQARRHDDGLREAVMTKMDKPNHFSRRAMLAGRRRRRGFGRRAGRARYGARRANRLCARRQAAARSRSALLLHRDQCGRHGVRLLRQDGHGPGPLCLHRPDGGGRARRAFQGRHRVHGRHPYQREPGRRVRLDRHPARRRADARRGGGGAARAGRDGVPEARPSGRCTHRHRRCRAGQGRSDRRRRPTPS